jgi:hypothetical protein
MAWVVCGLLIGSLRSTPSGLPFGAGDHASVPPRTQTEHSAVRACKLLRVASSLGGDADRSNAIVQVNHWFDGAQSEPFGDASFNGNPLAVFIQRVVFF